MVIDPEGAQNLDRTMLEIDGRRTVRLSYEVGGEPLPGGTPNTLYAVDVGAGPDGRDRTLFVDRVGLTGFEYESVETLDRMPPTVEITP